MVAIILTESIFGASSSCTDLNGVFGSNYLRCPCFSSRFSLSETPFWEISLGNKRVKKQKRILGLGRVSCSLGNGIVDKEELEFKPSFDEYLKAMESLKEKKKSDSVIRRKKGEEEKGKFGKSVVKKCVESSDVVEKREGVGAVEEKGSGGKLEFRKVVIEKRESISKAKHVDEMDRAAFKSMDDDAYDKPRVTKADMEQRIQRLAKW